MEVQTETPIRIDDKPSLGKRVYAFAKDKIAVNFVRFSGEQNPKNDPTKAALLLIGWPMRADAQITWGQPQMLAKEFGVTTYEIDGRPKGHFTGNSTDLEVEGIRQFAAELEQRGIKEITLYGHSIGAPKAMDLAVALEQKNPNLVVNVVLINPVGIYPQDFWKIAKNYVIEAPKVEGRTRNPARMDQPHLKVLVDICASLFKDLKAAKLQYPKLFADQRRVLTQLNSSLAKIKSPVLILLASDDPVVELDRVLPQEQLSQVTAGPLSNEDTRDRMARMSQERERYLRESVFTSASDVKVIVATKFANHIAFGVERPRPTSHIIAEYFDRLRR